ncbi:uncharacterized protein LOC123884289 [Trifolium pratense]|uniref:Uncharacterized protein n=1 Tax=Trifolium pratense TaxID=57577 RepID=A0ACB0J2A1_TRIPR|nr:uncharacterized protein LOC123884289 [Trifolium pratense]CAJ2638236.1 unnamed protein product [Trifolium pratense]
MANSEMKNIVMITVMTMAVIIFGLTNAGDAPPPTKNPIGEIICIGKCAFTCKDQLSNFSAYLACVVGCGLTCQNTFSEVAYECTTSCAYSKSNNANIDARNINAIVNSCMETCKNN